MGMKTTKISNTIIMYLKTFLVTFWKNNNIPSETGMNNNGTARNPKTAKTAPTPEYAAPVIKMATLLSGIFLFINRYKKPAIHNIASTIVIDLVNNLGISSITIEVDARAAPAIDEYSLGGVKILAILPLKENTANVI